MLLVSLSSNDKDRNNPKRPKKFGLFFCFVLEKRYIDKISVFMKFSEWKTLNEHLKLDFLKDRSIEVKDLLKDKLKLYAVPDFETFNRTGEPEQQSNLFTDEELRTFSFNYTTKGELYSLDFWKKNSSKPVATYYVDSVEKDPLQSITNVIPEILENPSRKSTVKVKPKVLQEDSSSVSLTPQSPKPAVSADPDVKKAEKYMSDEYDMSDPETIFEDLEAYVKMVVKGTQPSLLITGSPGVGKTYLVTKIIKDYGLKKDEDYIHVKGRSTAAGMYMTLYENNGKIIVFDDCDSVFGSPDAVNILKGALDSYGEREIAWLVAKPLKTEDGKNVPKKFIFDGKVIFISNLPQRKIDDAIKSRSFVIEVALSPEDMLKKMRKDLPKISPEVPLATREEALDFVESVSKKSKNLELNMRTLIKAIKILQEIDNLSVAKRLILQQCSYR